MVAAARAVCCSSCADGKLLFTSMCHGQFEDLLCVFGLFFISYQSALAVYKSTHLFISSVCSDADSDTKSCYYITLQCRIGMWGRRDVLYVESQGFGRDYMSLYVMLRLINMRATRSSVCCCSSEHTDDRWSLSGILVV